MKPLRAVVDTNVLISAIAFGGPPAAILDLATKGRIRMVLSEKILDELTYVLLDRKFQYPKGFISLVLQELRSLGEIVEPLARLKKIIRDPKDHHVLECVLSGKASHIVTGDHDLLVLKAYSHVTLLTPAQFLKFVDEPHGH